MDTLNAPSVTVAALNIGVPDARVPFDELEPRYLPVLKRAAKDVESALA